MKEVEGERGKRYSKIHRIKHRHFTLFLCLALPFVFLTITPSKPYENPTHAGRSPLGETEKPSDEKEAPFQKLILLTK